MFMYLQYWVPVGIAFGVLCAYLTVEPGILSGAFVKMGVEEGTASRISFVLKILIFVLGVGYFLLPKIHLAASDVAFVLAIPNDFPRADARAFSGMLGLVLGLLLAWKLKKYNF